MQNIIEICTYIFTIYQLKQSKLHIAIAMQMAIAQMDNSTS